MEVDGIIESLRGFDLSINEAKSYLALNRLDKATTTGVANEAKIHNSKSHEAMNSLVNKGLASYRVKGKKKIFFALEPEILLKKLEEKQKIAKIVISELKKMRKKTVEKQGIFAYEKIEGAKTVHRTILLEMKKNKEYLVLAGRPLNLKLEGFLLDFHKKRARKGVKAKIIHNIDNYEYAKLREKIKLTKVRYVKEYFPTNILIYEDYVAIIASVEEPMSALIKSKEIANSFRTYFNLIWKNGKTCKTLKNAKNY